MNLLNQERTILLSESDTGSIRVSYDVIKFIVNKQEYSHLFRWEMNCKHSLLTKVFYQTSQESSPYRRWRGSMLVLFD